MTQNDDMNTHRQQHTAFVMGNNFVTFGGQYSGTCAARPRVGRSSEPRVRLSLQATSIIWTGSPMRHR